MKYIIYKNESGRECGFVFQDRKIHADVAEYFGNVISAGFCEPMEGRGWSVWGLSESLGLRSRQGDGDILAQSSPAYFTAGERVIYVPIHAHSDLNHPDCEPGTVSSTNRRFVFVKFDRPVKNVGCLEIEGPTPKACFPTDLVHIPQG